MTPILWFSSQFWTKYQRTREQITDLSVEASARRLHMQFCPTPLRLNELACWPHDGSVGKTPLGIVITEFYKSREKGNLSILHILYHSPWCWSLVEFRNVPELVALCTSIYLKRWIQKQWSERVCFVRIPWNHVKSIEGKTINDDQIKKTASFMEALFFFLHFLFFKSQLYCPFKDGGACTCSGLSLSSQNGVFVFGNCATIHRCRAFT